jgi:hypothetical protein
VALTDEPSGTTVQGTWTLSKDGYDILAGGTKYGVYLPHGRYHLVIAYQSPHGTPQAIEQDLDL